MGLPGLHGARPPDRIKQPCAPAPSRCFLGPRPPCSDWCALDVGAQSCSGTDFFPPFNWTLEATAAQCNGAFGGDNWSVTPRPSSLPDSFGLRHLSRFAQLPSSSSRIIWTYGMRDPWHVGGLINGLQPPYSLNRESVVITIEDGSHCADMAPSSADDSASMLAARGKVEATLRKWLGA